MKRMLLSLALAASALASPLGAQASAVVFSASASHINVGDSVTVDVRITGLGAQVLSAYDLNFRYAAGLLDMTSFNQSLSQFGTEMHDIGEPAGPATLTNGDLAFWLNSLETDASLEASQLDDFLLFSFTLAGLADGSTTFTLGQDPDFERNFVGLQASNLDPTVGGVCIAVGNGSCAVPEPGTYGLVGLALASALLPAWRRRSHRHDD